MGKKTKEDRVGLKLSQDVVLKVSWKDLLSTLVDGVENAVKSSHGDLLSAGKLVVGMLELVGAFKPETPVGSRALEIIVLSFAVAVEHTSAAHPGGRVGAKAAMKAAISQCKEKSHRGEAVIPFDFFESPHRCGIYIEMRDYYISNIFENNNDSFLIASEKYRIDQAFRSGVWELWHSKMSVFEELAKVLNSPIAEASDFDRQWSNYRAKLISEFHVKPVFGQEETLVPLSALYVPLRCSWTAKEGELPSSFKVPKGVSESRYLCVDWMETQLFAWLDNPDPHDWLRLVGGGPGSGKSTSARAFAAKVAERDDVQPMFIPLQRLDSHLKLRDAINNYFVSRTGSPFLAPPLDRRFVESAPRLLLIFDGLDEIARPGESANSIARDMIDRIRSLYNELTGDGNVLHKILVTGRTVSFDAARQTADRKGNEALEVVNYAEISNPQVVAVSGEKPLLNLDQRPTWWQKYSAALGRSQTLPEAFSDARLDSITSEPLLCYLCALSGYLENNAKEAAGNRSRIYLRLLRDVWRRGWGGGRAGPGRQLDQADFDRLFETMALAAWHGGDERLATYDRFERALEIMRAREVFDKFSRAEGGDVSNLAVNFYLKNSDSSGKGFEFTHKSFGEYLAARALFRISDFVVNLFDIREELAAGEWLKGVSTGVLSQELLAFLRDEARLRVEKDVEDCISAKRKLERIFGRVQSTGFPHASGGEGTWRDAENVQRSSEALLLAVLNAYAGAISEFTGDVCLIDIDWPDEFSLGNLIHRQRAVRNQDIPVQFAFSYISSTKQNLLGVEAINFNFQNSRFESVTFFRSIMPGATFDGAKLINVEFSNAMLSRTSFAAAQLDDVVFDRCMAEDVSFQNTVLTDVKFQSTVLDGSDFEFAEFAEVSESGASFLNVDISAEQNAEISVSDDDDDDDVKSGAKLRRLKQRRDG